MDANSKVAQKLITLLSMTLVILVTNFLTTERFVRAASESSQAEAVVGKTAPEFSLKDIDGKSWDLKGLRGKVVVLEWFNHGCPFVKKHYNSGNMQKLQKEFTGKQVVWLSICSSAPGKQGFEKPEDYARLFKEKKASPTAVLPDPTGRVGHLYGAKTTPHMFIIDKKGELVYAGAIDDDNGFDPSGVKTARNYVKQALDEVLAGKKVTTASTKSYGCSVKYQ